jgi:hypothetical protein
MVGTRPDGIVVGATVLPIDSIRITPARPERLRCPESEGRLGNGRTGFQPVPDRLQGPTLFGAGQQRKTTRMFVKGLPRSRQAGSPSYCIVPAELGHRHWNQHDSERYLRERNCRPPDEHPVSGPDLSHKKRDRESLPGLSCDLANRRYSHRVVASMTLCAQRIHAVASVG